MRRNYRCSLALLQVLYEQLELKRRMRADKFHVLRLVTPAIHRYLKALGLGREALPLCRVLLGDAADLGFHTGPAEVNRESQSRRLTVEFNVRGRDLRSLALIGFRLWLAFRSVRNAVLIFLNVPFAIVGGVTALWLRSRCSCYPHSRAGASLHDSGASDIGRPSTLDAAGAEPGARPRAQPLRSKGTVGVIAARPIGISNSDERNDAECKWRRPLPRRAMRGYDPAATVRPYIDLTLHVLAFAFWSSFWPRRAIKGRLEPLVGFRAYRLFYNSGTILLFCTSFAYLAQHSTETVRLWDLRGYDWFRPLIYAIEGLGVFFLSACLQLGSSFWGLTNPPEDRGLETGGFYKITRHPLYWSVFCLLFGHMLVFGTALGILYLVLMELYNVAGVIAFENRGLAARYGEAFTSFHARTSTIPFKSLLQGKAPLEAGKLPRGALVGSVIFTLTVAWLHAPVLARLMYSLPTIAALRGADP